MRRTSWALQAAGVPSASDGDTEANLADPKNGHDD